MNDEFIDRTFGENNQVEVVGWFGERRGNGKLYTVKCSECTNSCSYLRYTKDLKHNEAKEAQINNACTQRLGLL